MDATITNRRLEYLAAQDRPAPADLAGTWSGVMWVNDGQIDIVTIVLKKRGPGYEATLADTLGLIPARATPRFDRRLLPLDELVALVGQGINRRGERHKPGPPGRIDLAPAIRRRGRPSEPRHSAVLPQTACPAPSGHP